MGKTGELWEMSREHRCYGHLQREHPCKSRKASWGNLLMSFEGEIEVSLSRLGQREGGEDISAGEIQSNLPYSSRNGANFSVAQNPSAFHTSLPSLLELWEVSDEVSWCSMNQRWVAITSEVTCLWGLGWPASVLLDHGIIFIFRSNSQFGMIEHPTQSLTRSERLILPWCLISVWGGESL